MASAFDVEERNCNWLSHRSIGYDFTLNIGINGNVTGISGRILPRLSTELRTSLTDLGALPNSQSRNELKWRLP